MARVSLEEADGRADAAQGVFLKLEDDGDKAVLSFLLKDKNGNDLIEAQESVYNEKTGKNEDYDPVRHAGMQAKVRFVFNVWCFKVFRGNKWRDVNSVKLMAMTPKTFTTARSAMDKYKGNNKSISQIVFEVERKGKPRDPQTHYPILPEQPMYTDDPKYGGADKAIAAASLYNPSKQNDQANEAAAAAQQQQQQQQSSQQQQYAPAQSAPATSPIAGTDITTGIANRIKGMPGSTAVVEKFLSTFGIQRIRELKEDQVLAAAKFLDDLSSNGTPAPAPAAVVDPFA